MENRTGCKHRRRKLIEEAALFLVAGAVVTIAAAWLIAVRVTTQSMFGQSVFTPTQQFPDPVSYGWTGPLTLEWPVRVPRDWAKPHWVGWSRATGLEWVSGRVEANMDLTPLPIHSAVATRTGWPFYALEWREVALLDDILHEDTTAKTVLTPLWAGGIRLPDAYANIAPGGGLNGARRLPTVPLFPGFPLDTTICGGALWIVAVGPFRLRRAMLTRRRSKRGQCLACGYPKGPGLVCAECGVPVIEEPA